MKRFLLGVLFAVIVAYLNAFMTIFILSDFVRYTFFLPMTLLEPLCVPESHIPYFGNLAVFAIIGFFTGYWVGGPRKSDANGAAPPDRQG